MRRERQDAAQAQAVTGSVAKEDDTARNREERERKRRLLEVARKREERERKRRERVDAAARCADDAALVCESVRRGLSVIVVIVARRQRYL